MKKALVLSLICVLGVAFSGLAATLSGSWDTDVKINPQQTDFSAALTLTSKLTVIYTVGDWAFTSITALTDAGWKDQDFSVAGVLGAFTLTSGLDFTPNVPEFGSWKSSASVSIAGVSFGASFNLVKLADIEFYGYGILPVQTVSSPVKALLPIRDLERLNDLSLSLTASGTAGDVTVSVAVTFGSPNVRTFYVAGGAGLYGWDATLKIWVLIAENVKIVVAGNSTSYLLETAPGSLVYAASKAYASYKFDDAVLAAVIVDGPAYELVEECDLDWTGIAITVGFPFCCADITAVVEFDCTGFEFASFTVKGIAIPNLPWVTLDAKVKYTIDEKDLTLSPKFDFGAIVCFDLWISVDDAKGVVDNGWTFNSISIDGISLTCDIGGVTFTGASYWGSALSGTKHPFYFSSTNNKSAYWEYYRIATSDDGCCGPFGFDLSFYFLDTGVKLFEIGLIDANMTLQIASQFTFNMGLEINVDTGAFTEWTIGFLVTW